METPLWNFEKLVDVYEPAEDSFLLLDTLECDLQLIKSKKPVISLEIGSGSGIIITALANALGNTTHCIAIDININACYATQDTAAMNSSLVDIVQGDLCSCLKAECLIDLLVFNPPYVVTVDDEVSGSLQRAWAGGTKGRVVIDRLIPYLASALSPKALFYLVAIKENEPEEIIDRLKLQGFIGQKIAHRKIRGEDLSVLRFSRE